MVSSFRYKVSGFLVVVKNNFEFETLNVKLIQLGKNRMFSLKHKILFFIALSSFFEICFSKFAELIKLNETFYNSEFIDAGKSVLWVFGSDVFTYFKHT